MELYYVVTIVDREKVKTLIDIYGELGVSLVLENLGNGTATKEHLLLYDLEKTEKSIVNAVVTSVTLEKLVRSAKSRMMIDVPGNGIIISIPIKSVVGGKNFEYITEGQELGGTAPDMNFENEMIVVILNEGYSDMIMDAARGAGASGGTVFHAKGTVKSEKFHGVSLADEKDMIYILATSDKKSDIMKAINQNCGRHTEAGAICFSMPVSEVVGLRTFKEEE
jgi:nitrogen regulatory protein PII